MQELTNIQQEIAHLTAKVNVMLKRNGIQAELVNNTWPILVEKFNNRILAIAESQCGMCGLEIASPLCWNVHLFGTLKGGSNRHHRCLGNFLDMHNKNYWIDVDGSHNIYTDWRAFYRIYNEYKKEIDRYNVLHQI